MKLPMHGTRPNGRGPSHAARTSAHAHGTVDTLGRPLPLDPYGPAVMNLSTPGLGGFRTSDRCVGTQQYPKPPLSSARITMTVKVLTLRKAFYDEAPRFVNIVLIDLAAVGYNA